MNRYKVGDRVRHVRLGLGRVVRAYSDDIKIRFDSFSYNSVDDGHTFFYRNLAITPVIFLEESKTQNSSGGPSSYYDFDGEWVTLNDMMESLSQYWLGASLHFKDIFKAGFRWGRKDGTTKIYDAKKIVYSGLRLLIMEVGVEKTREYLQELLDDKQFQEKK